MDLYLNLMPDLRNIVTGYFGNVIFSHAQDEVNEVTFATAGEFRKSRAVDCIFINFEITSTNHYKHPSIPNTLLRCSGVPKIKTHTLAYMFYSSKFNGDISRWDVSSVDDMSRMFCNSKFNGDLSQWDVSKVTNMYGMFHTSQFNSNLLTWDVSSVTYMCYMFYNSLFNGDISQWGVSNVTNMSYMFFESLFNGDISKWDVSKVTNMSRTFRNSKIKKETVHSWDNFKNHNINEMFE
jgi:surface protein